MVEQNRQEKLILQCRKFKSANGERGVLLVDKNTGLPTFYENLYLTIHHRNKSDAFNTMRSVLGILEHFAIICTYLNIDLVARFGRGELLTPGEIELIAKWTMKTKCSLKDELRKNVSKKVSSPGRKRLELTRFIVVIDTDMVKSKTSYNRLLYISKYLVWLANFFSQVSYRDIEKMKIKFEEELPEISSWDFEPDNFRSLTEAQKLSLLKIVEVDSPDNPWISEAVRFRNKVIVHLYFYIGCRKSELLTLKTLHLDPGKRTINIRRCPDSSDDPRTDPPQVKTLGRDIEVDYDLYELVETYVINYRSKVKGANKCPYLFLSHQTGSHRVTPLSISTVDKIFKELSEVLGFKLNAHALRHTWNDEFSEDIESALDNGEITESEAEDLRSYLMGWKEDSGTAKTYTKRYQHKKSMKFGLQLQRKRISKNYDCISLAKEDVSF